MTNFNTYCRHGMVLFSVFLLCAILTITPAAGTMREAALRPGIGVSASMDILLDTSTTNEGYFTVTYTGQDAAVDLYLLNPDSMEYRFTLQTGEASPIPLNRGNGRYTIAVTECASWTGYQPEVLYTQTLEVKIDNELLPFLHPNHVVRFDDSAQAIQAGRRVTAGASTQRDAADRIFSFVVQSITYDNAKMLRAIDYKNYATQRVYINPGKTLETDMVLTGIDNTYLTGKGICGDFSILMAALLRSQGIPAKVVLGITDDGYHAWVSAYIDGGWVEYDPTFDYVGDFSGRQVLGEL